MPPELFGNIPAANEPRPVGPGFNESVRRFSLRGILDDRFAGELDRLEASVPDLEEEFLETLRSPVNFEAFRGELTSLAESVTNQLFGAGGAVEQGFSQATGGAIARGMDPRSGTAARGRQNVLSQAAGQVRDVVGQGAVQLANTAVADRAQTIQSLLGFTQGQQARSDSLRESIFGGQATIDQAGLAREQFDLNKMLVEESLRRQRSGGGIGGFLGKIGGGLLGSALGPLGATVGSRLGGSIGDALFGPEQAENPFERARNS